MRISGLIVCIALLFLSGCTKSTITTTSKIYVIGNDGTATAIWKSGVENIIGGTMTVRTAYLYDVSIYLGGNVGAIPSYSKNGQVISLPISGGPGAVNAMFANATDTYAGGYQTLNGITIATYWKNGFASPLPAATSAAVNSITVSGTDIYAAGYDGHSAVYWKNGIKTTLADGGSSNAYGNEIAVLGSDVVVTGYDGSKLVYWKNGVATSLTYSPTATDPDQKGLALSGNDVYMSGSQTIGGNKSATYWKNGSPVIVGSSDAARGIFVVGNDIYLSGHHILNGGAQACYWKNGSQTLLSYTQLGDGSGYYITVK